MLTLLGRAAKAKEAHGESRTLVAGAGSEGPHAGEELGRGGPDGAGEGGDLRGGEGRGASDRDNERLGDPSSEHVSLDEQQVSLDERLANEFERFGSLRTEVHQIVDQFL